MQKKVYLCFQFKTYYGFNKFNIFLDKSYDYEDDLSDTDKNDIGGTPGRPGIDYPTLAVIPQTSFDCKIQRYKGFFGDPETKCQVNRIGI